MFTDEIYSQENSKERKDCSIRAFAVAACVSYSTAQKLFLKHGRKPNKGTPGWVTEKVIEDQFPNAERVNERLTLPKFAKKYNKGHFIVHVKGHALAIVDGVIHDWRLRPKTKVWNAWQLV